MEQKILQLEMLQMRRAGSEGHQEVAEDKYLGRSNSPLGIDMACR